MQNPIVNAKHVRIVDKICHMTLWQNVAPLFVALDTCLLNIFFLNKYDYYTTDVAYCVFLSDCHSLSLLTDTGVGWTSERI